jgi:glyoxylase-like metal-dependent hydrolase (beta-lactamase superfamily II)
MPTKTFTDKMTLGRGKDQIDLYYFGAGHTDGDAFVVFKELKTVCVGDLMAWNMAPLIDPNAGGSIVALGETFKKAEKGIKNVDTVIEGHGNVNTFKGMAAYGEFMRALVDTAREGLKKQWTTQQALDELTGETRVIRARATNNPRAGPVRVGPVSFRAPAGPRVAAPNADTYRRAGAFGFPARQTRVRDPYADRGRHGA